MSRPRLATLPGLLPILLFTACIPSATGIFAQDTRTVTEPTFPAVCTTLNAELLQTGNTLPSGDESSFDTTRVQSALNACANGEAVELAMDPSSGDNAFLIQPITIPTGVTLLVDAGVTVYGSRNPADYAVQSGSCGMVASSSAGCSALITIDSNNAGVMGYGVIDGRGGQTLTSGANAGTTWWQLAYQAQQENENQYVPQLFAINGNNITLYKITLQNSPTFHVTYLGTGFTAWDVKVIAPGDARNTDGIDPGPAQNVTITNSYIGDGDDNIALKPSEHPGGGAAYDMSITNDHFYVGHGMSIGSQTAGGASNILVQNLDIDGDPTNNNDTGIRIKSESSNGGLVTNITYQNVCMQNVTTAIQFNPYYDSTTGTDYPQFQNITLSDVTVLTPGTVQLQGYSTTYPLGLTLDNVNFSSISSSEVSAEDADVTLGPGPVNFSSYISGTGVSVTNSVTDPSEAAYSCPSSSFPLLAPEFFGSATSLAPSQPLTLTAIFEPVHEPNWEGSTAGEYSSTSAYYPVEPTGTVTFYDGSTEVDQVTLSGTSDLATATLSSESAGTQSYTAVYSGDANYAAMTSPAFTVTVAYPSTTITLTSSPTTINAGQTVTLTATLTSSEGTPTGTVTFMDGSSTLGTVTLNGSGVAAYTTTALPAGNQTITATYAATGAFAASTSTPLTIAVQSLTISASSTTLSVSPGGSASTTLTFTGAGGLTGNISYSCSGLPSYMSCSFNPSSTTFNASSTASAVLTVSEASTLSGWLIPFLPLSLLGFLTLGRKHRRRWALVAIAAAGIGFTALTGCNGGSSSSSSTSQTPPAGQQTATVTATTTTAAGALTSTISITVNAQ